MIRYNAYTGCHTPTRPLGIAPRPKEEVTPRTSAGHRRFTDAEDARLLDLKGEGLSWTQIGKRLDRAANSCLSRYFKLTGTLA